MVYDAARPPPPALFAIIHVDTFDRRLPTQRGRFGSSGEREGPGDQEGRQFGGVGVGLIFGAFFRVGCARYNHQQLATDLLSRTEFVKVRLCTTTEDSK